MKKLFSLILFSLLPLQQMLAQGIIVREKDGTETRIPYERLDRITVYDATPEPPAGEDKAPCQPVDLGLSVKWASCNVGATVPEGYGHHFAWGEVTPKTEFSWDNYLYGSAFNDATDLGANIGGTAYDVARTEWGGTWRMPTADEWRELLEKCEWEWTEVNGCYGRRATGPNGNSIFLPAAGSTLGSYVSGRGEECFYWSATQNPEWVGEAFLAQFITYEYERDAVFAWERYRGFSVRPVCQ